LYFTLDFVCDKPSFTSIQQYRFHPDIKFEQILSVINITSDIKLVSNSSTVDLNCHCMFHFTAFVHIMPSSVFFFNPVQPSGHYTYRQFNIQHFYVLPTQCIYLFYVDLRTNSDYFTIQHQLTGFYNRHGKCLLRGLDWVFRHCNSAIEARVLTQVSASEICGGRDGILTSFFPSTPVLPSQYHSTNAPHSSPSTCCSNQKGKRSKPGILPKSTLWRK